MKYVATLFALMVLVPGWAGASAYDFAVVVDQHIKPRYKALSSATTDLNGAAARYCATPSDNGLTAVKMAYRDAFLAWQGAQHLRFGPIKYLSREYRYAMWPDKRGTVGKHLRRLRDDPALHDAEFDISQKSVAVQGFSALERLLYADEPPDQTGCRILGAITSNLAAMSSALIDDWFGGDEPYAGFLTTPGPENPLFADDTEVAAELLNSLYTELELVITQKLGNPLGSAPERVRGRRAEAWRSELALPAIQANLAATEAFHQVAFAPALRQTEPGNAIDQQITAGFAAALASLAALDSPLADAVETPGGYAALKELQARVSAVKLLVTRDLAQTLALPIGFNSLDGD